jgi:hypothetical protein
LPPQQPVQQQPVPQSVPQQQAWQQQNGEARRQPTAAELIALAEGRVPDLTAPAAPAEPVEQERPRMPEPQLHDVFAPKVAVAAQSEPQYEAPQPAPTEESVVSGGELTVEVGLEALMSYQETHGQDPDQERLAQFLFDQYGVSGRRPGSPASRSEMARIWTQLQDRYATMGRE